MTTTGYSQRIFCGGCAALSVLLAGCYSRVNEDKLFIAANATRQDLSLVRITVDGYADMADMKFRAGFHNAAAIDEVLKGEVTPITIQSNEPDDAALNRTANEIVEILSRKLKDAYENRRPLEEIKQLESELTRARSLPRIVRAAETSQISEAPAQKYLIAFSADPSKVFKAIADTTARGDAEGAIFKSLREFEKNTDAQRAAETSASHITWNALLASTTNGLPADATKDPSVEGYEALRKQLLRYQVVLQDYLSVAP